MKITGQQPSFAHLKRLTTSHGLQEHALIDEPRAEHGHCLDDVSRAFILLCREPQLDPESRDLLDLYLSFTYKAISEDGACHNRMDLDGHWTDEPTIGDWWGRATWALGFGAVHAPEPEQRARALSGFRILAQNSSPDLRTMSFAALGAGELLLALPGEIAARKILMDAHALFTPAIRTDWSWPEPRLRYANGSVAEAVMLTGWALKDTATAERGLEMLEFLVDVETRLGHFSVTPVGGRGPGETEMGFDQQPIEVAAIADACARAWAITGESRWIDELNRAWGWFLGDNDVGAPMFDPETGGGYDGLHHRGPNLNQGAESTIAMLSTAQQAYWVDRQYMPTG
ncbi:MAG TPA: hypothetical protein VF307_07150 [Candidatus Nanopelagicaceae bacterium]